MTAASITTRTATISLQEDGIVTFVALPNAEMTLADAKEGNAACVEVSNGKKRPRFCDYSLMRSQDGECRRYYASKETARDCLACAILINSPLSKVIGNFYMGLNKPVTPTRLFTSRDEAMAWLRSFPYGE